jgi:ketosteroid isomerase-like protein
VFVAELNVPSCFVRTFAIRCNYTLVSYRRGSKQWGIMKKQTYAEYEAAEPYFELVRGALGDLVDGEHFFDVIADNIVYEVLYDLGWPRRIRGRANLMSQFGGYGGYITLQSADHLITHKGDDGRTVVIEYEVHGTVLATGVKYNNRFCSIITIESRKIVHWRDYMDSLAAWRALNSKQK